MGNPLADWEYSISVAGNTSSIDGSVADVDLYVSAIDARYPTSEDFDFKSDNLGPDDVFIRARDDFWAKTGYGKQYGILFVVGVKALSDNANYTLMVTGPQRYEVNYTILNSTWLTKTFNYNGPKDPNPPTS